MAQTAFGSDFCNARALFRDAAVVAGAALDSHAHPDRGPDGSDLATDVAWLGPLDAANVLVTVSGTHGVEGFCGSGAQVDWLRRGEAKRLPADTAAMLVHAINPHGFAWLRRVTQENVDLNRNWIDFDAALPANPAYDTLAELLCPREWTEESRRDAMQGLLAYVAQEGMPAFVHAVSSGQYRHAQGLFYGGLHATWSRRTLTAILTQRLSRARRVAFVDYHTGLGPEGFGEVMISEPAGDPAFLRARSWYGARVIPVGTRESASARIGGDWLGAIGALLPQVETTGVALEFGTVEPMRVLEALRADAWLHAHGDPLAAAAEPIKAQIRGAFYLDDDVWRGMVLGQSLVACRQAVTGLAE